MSFVFDIFALDMIFVLSLLSKLIQFIFKPDSSTFFKLFGNKKLNFSAARNLLQSLFAEHRICYLGRKSYVDSAKE